MVTCCALFVVTHLNIPMNDQQVASVAAYYRSRRPPERGGSSENGPKHEDTRRRTDANVSASNGGFLGAARNPYAPTKNSRTILTIRLEDLYGPGTFEKPVGLSTVKPYEADPVAKVSKRESLTAKPTQAAPAATGFKPESLAEKPTQADPVAKVSKPESLTAKPTQADPAANVSEPEPLTAKPTQADPAANVSEPEPLTAKPTPAAPAAKDGSQLSQDNSHPPSDLSSHVCGGISSAQASEMIDQLAKILEQTQKQNKTLLEENNALRADLSEVKQAFGNVLQQFKDVREKVVAVMNLAHDLKSEVADLRSKQTLQESPVGAQVEYGSEKSFDGEEMMLLMSSDNSNLHNVPTSEQDGGIELDSETSGDGVIEPETQEISPQVVAQIVEQEDPMHQVPVQRFIREMPGFLSAKFPASGSDSGTMPAFWGLVSEYDLYRDVYNAFLDMSEELGKLGIEMRSEDLFQYEKVFNSFSEINVAPDRFDADAFSEFKKEKGVGVAITTSMIPDGRPGTYISRFNKTVLARKEHPKKFAKAAIMAYFKWGTGVSKRFKEKLDALGPLGD